MMLCSLPGQKARSRGSNKGFSRVGDYVALNIDDSLIKISLTDTNFVSTAFYSHNVLAFQGLFHFEEVGFL